MKARLFSIFIVVVCLFSAVVGPAAAGGATVPRPPALLAAAPVSAAAQVFVAHNITPLNHYGGWLYTLAIQGHYAYVGEGYGLTILDVADPSAPVSVGRAGLFHSAPVALAAAGNYVYIGEETGILHVFDVSDPSHPAELGAASFFAFRAIAVAGHYAYAASGGNGLRVIDVADPANLQEVGHYNTPGDATAIQLSGHYAYIADRWGGLRIVDIANPAKPVSVGSIATVDAQGLTVVGNLAYVADYSNLRIFNVSDPSTPVALGVWNDATATAVKAVAVYGSYAYVDGDNHWSVLDVSNPAAPAWLSTQSFPVDICFVLSGHYLYTASTAAVTIYDLSLPAQPQSLVSYSAVFADQVGVHNGQVYVAGGTLTILDMTDPLAPTVSGVSATGGLGLGRGITFVDHYAYIASGGLYIYDIADVSNPVQVGYYATLGSAVAVDVWNNYAYVATDLDLEILDVHNPAHITEEGSFNQASSARRVQVIPRDGSVYVAIASTDCGLQIANVDTPSDPVLVSTIPNGGSYYRIYDVAVKGQYAYIAETDQDTLIYDLSDLTQPQQIGTLSMGGMQGNGTKLYLTDNRLYALSTSGTAGDVQNLRVYNVDDPAHPVEKGYYSEITGSDFAAANGWIYVGARWGGLLTLQFVDPPPAFAGFAPLSAPVGASVTLTGTDFTGATAVMFNGASAAFVVGDDTLLTATVPVSATAGPISLTTPFGSSTSLTSFTPLHLVYLPLILDRRTQ